MLFGQRIKIFTDHKNLTYHNTKFANDRVLRQRLLLEEYAPEIVHIEGEKNEAADTLSRVPQKDNHCVDEQIMETMAMEAMAVEHVRVPVDYDAIHEAQVDDKELKELRIAKNNFKQQEFVRIKLWLKKSLNDGKYRIFVPKSLRNELIEWYHEALMHP